MTAFLKALLMSRVVQVTASALIVLAAWRLLGTLEMCGTVVFLVLLYRAMKRGIPSTEGAGGRG